MPMLKSLAANNPRIQHPIGLACAAVAMVALTPYASHSRPFPLRARYQRAHCRCRRR